MSPSEIGMLLTAGGALGAVLAKVFDLLAGKGIRGATRDKMAAEAHATDQVRAQGEVTMLREIIQEVRTSEAQKAERIDNLERRLDLLEERERHMLTRAAVHEAWDQMAFAILSQVNPEHPPPPPLTAAEHSHDHDHDQQ